MQTTQQGESMRITRNSIILALVGTIALAAAGWHFAGRSQGKVSIQRTETVARGSVRKALDATGIIKPEVGAIVKTGSRFSGNIRKMYVKVGDPVTAGQIIAEIDDREQRAQRDEAAANLRKAESELARIDTSYPLQIAEAAAQSTAAKAESEYAELTRQRKAKLVEQDLEARNTLDEAAQRAKTLSNILAARDATVNRLRGEYTSARKGALSTVEQTRAALSTAEVRLSYSIIRSPMNGVVSQVTAQEGEMVVAGFQVVNLITILDPKRVEMWIYVDETDVGQVKSGMDVEFRVDSLPGRTFKGVVDQIYPQPEIRDNIVYYQALVRITPEEAKDLRPEMTTQCRVVISRKDNVLTVPNEALKWVGGETVVFVDDSGTVRRVKPELGLAGVDSTEVVSGLAEGDKVGTKVTLPGGEKKKGKP